VNAAAGPIVWRLHIPAPPDTVFAALDSDEGRAGFWAESAVETAAVIHFKFPDGTSHAAPILDRTPPARFAIEYFGAPATFELTSDGRGGTDLVLTHEGVGADEWHEVHAGWLSVLLPLKAWVAHGVDLRNHDPGRTWAQGYVDQ